MMPRCGGRLTAACVFWGCTTIFGAGGCDDAGRTAAAESTTTTATASARPAIAIGSEVVAAWGHARFRQGKVVMIQPGGKVTIEHGAVDEKTGKRATSTVELSRCWLIGDGLAGQAVTQGDHLICRTDDRTELWLPCRITAVAGDHLEAEDHRGQAHRLDRRALVRPDAATVKAIEEHLASEARHRKFAEAFTAAGAPYRPEGYQPAEGDEVVAPLMADSYYGARVLAVKAADKKIRVEWEGRAFAAMELDADRVVPRPAADRPAPAPVKGQLVLVRPARSSQAWEHCQVTAVKGEQLVVVNRDDQPRTVGIADVIAIVKPGP